MALWRLRLGDVVRSAFRLLGVAALVLACSASTARAQPVFVFDYSLDANGFFTDPARRAVLQTAGQMITSRLTDTLSAIGPDGVSSWSLTFPNPATGTTQSNASMSVPANTIYVFAGGRDLT